MPNVKIPKEYAKRKKLIAVPEREYRRFQAEYGSDEEIAAVRASEEDFRRGRFVTAPNIQAALKKARARGLID